jgi:peptide subunit release factor 1 (eRF1)
MPYSQELHRLAEWDSRPYHTMSLYLSLDQTREGRLQIFSQLTKNMEQSLKGNGWAKAWEGLSADMVRVGKVVEELPLGPDRGLVVFSCLDEDRFDVKTLPVLVPNLLEVGPTPYIVPLAALAGDYPKTLTVILDPKSCRFFISHMGQLDELSGLCNSAEPLVYESDGARSLSADSRVTRREDTAKQRQAKEIGQLMLELFQDQQCELLLIGGSKALLSVMESELHPYLAARLAGTFVCDVNCNLTTIGAAISQAQEEYSQERKLAELAKLEENLGPNGLATTGLNQVLASLHEGKVHSLFVRRSFKAPGGSCQSCGMLRHVAGPCPICGEEMTEVRDVVNLAVARALDSSAIVEQIQGDSPLDRMGGIAALLRYA